MPNWFANQLWFTQLAASARHATEERSSTPGEQAVAVRAGLDEEWCTRVAENRFWERIERMRRNPCNRFQ
jgi:hypothetical protein